LCVLGYSARHFGWQIPLLPWLFSLAGCAFGNYQRAMDLILKKTLSNLASKTITECRVMDSLALVLPELAHQSLGAVASPL